MAAARLATIGLLAVTVGGCAQDPELEQATIRIEGAQLDVLVAETPDQLSEGLQAVEEISEGEGMLFVWDEPADRVFEIKDVEYALDVIFIAADGRVVGIERLEPGSSDVASAGEPVLWVVETRAGWAEDAGVIEGSRLTLDGGS
jgi:uncharacterized membrane protein (UPF0127 family)